MSDRTSIEWTATVHPDGSVTPGATWNPVRGCSRVSDGCRHCYAEGIAARFSQVGQPFHGYATLFREKLTGRLVPGTQEAERRVVKDPRWTGYVQLIEDKLLEPLSWKKPRRIFVNSMSDLFHENLTDEAIDRVFAVMALCPQHVFQVLTKRPQRMCDYMNRPGKAADVAVEVFKRFTVLREADVQSRRAVKVWPLPNVWKGVSCENQATADERIPLLLQTPAALRFLSCEPLLAHLNIIQFLSDKYISVGGRQWIGAGGIHWVIAGAESGSNPREMKENWVRTIRDQCQSSGVAFFYKQKATPSGKKISMPELDGRQWAEFPRVEVHA